MHVLGWPGGGGGGVVSRFRKAICHAQECTLSRSGMQDRRTGFNCVLRLSLFSYIVNLIIESAQIALGVGY